MYAKFREENEETQYLKGFTMEEDMHNIQHAECIRLQGEKISVETATLLVTDSRRNFTTHLSLDDLDLEIKVNT